MTAQEFNEKVVPLGRLLYRYAFRYLENQEDSKDAVQEVFVKLWNLRSEIQAVKNIEAFAVRIMRNHCLDRIKLNKTVRLDLNDFFVNRPAGDHTPDRNMKRMSRCELSGRSSV